MKIKCLDRAISGLIANLVSPFIDDRHVNIIYKDWHFLSSRRTIGRPHPLVHKALNRSLQNKPKLLGNATKDVGKMKASADTKAKLFYSRKWKCNEAVSYISIKLLKTILYIFTWNMRGVVAEEKLRHFPMWLSASYIDM